MSVGKLSGATPTTRLDAQVSDSEPLIGMTRVEADRRDETCTPAGQATTPPPLPDRTGSLPSSAIHELRTPLTSIHGYAQILQRSVMENPRASNAVDVILRESTRLTQMLAELSDVVELGSPAMPPNRAEIDLRELCESAAESVTFQDAGQHRFTVQGDARLYADARRLTQALLHILTNATRYSPAESEVLVQIRAQDGCVLVVVTDHGIGVPSEDTERIYEPFVRGGNARQLGSRGLGLGLCLAQGALALEGGTLRHEPCPTGGTTFIIELPRR
jgi:signal transduction histidine kinase